ncbi:MAG: COX15/CtaA family protein [Balneolaceae bacterium]|nr:COX15/CtaA family protein [Balneolaceae bacterium]
MKLTLNAYQKTAVTTVGATLFLIFVGGLVRAAGAGLGCPDWPKCFGSWVPPLTAAELPPGFEASQFNVFKTWTEYINRLIGLVIGLLITATFLLSIRYRKEEPHVFYSSAAAFVLVLVQGWLGGQVVISGLEGWLVTLHMFLAMVIITALLYAVFRATSRNLTIEINHATRAWLLWTGAFLLLFTVVQLVLGTQVREAIDLIKEGPNPPPRETWLSQVGRLDELHRSFSWTVFLSGGVVLYIARWRAESDLIGKLGLTIFGLIVFQILLGAGLWYLGMPPAYQVFHLVAAAFLICSEVLLLLLLWKSLES